MFQNLPADLMWLVPAIPMVISLVSATFAAWSLWYTRKTNHRAEQLFGSQVRPLVQEQPTGLVFPQGRPFAALQFVIVNYSGFDAHDVVYDMKFGDNAWVIQWIRARAHHAQQQQPRTPDDELYLRQEAEAPWRIPMLRAGESVTRSITFSLSLDHVRSAQGGLDVQSRITWSNERRQAFDRIRKFKLLCTTVESGMSVTFVPQGKAGDDE